MAKKDQEKEKAQVDDQDKSDVEVEDNYNLDHLNRKDKFIIMKIVEKNEELEEEIEARAITSKARIVSHLQDGRTKGSK